MSERLKAGDYLAQFIQKQQTFLTIGLDTDARQLPSIVGSDIALFNKSIIDATVDICVAYKINFAFYESLGRKGWDILAETINEIPETHLIIADAKRGDIGNTSEMYAKAVFDELGCDAITVSPYMGYDSVRPFYRDGKWVIILALTSNPGNHDFQQQQLGNGKKLYQQVMDTTAQWGHADNTMYVIGATHPDDMKRIREAYPDYFFLVPGIGVQGGDLDAICEAGVNPRGGLLINASRSILYASGGSDFAEKARNEAEKMNGVMRKYL